MKKILSIIFIVSVLSAGQLHWSRNYEKAVALAQKDAKPVLMMYHASWCPECSYMKEVIFKDPKLSAYMQSHFELVALDISKDKLPKGYSYKGVPTFYIISPDKRLLKKIEGASSAQAFLQKLESVK